MSNEMIFSAANILAMIGWLILLCSPYIPIWSDRIAGFAIPLILSAGYFALLVIFAILSDTDTGGYGSLAEVVKLFSFPNAVLAGWIHYLAFDLFIGAWQCRTARREGIHFGLVVPCLALTFLFGPIGLLLFMALRTFRKMTHASTPTANHL